MTTPLQPKSTPAFFVQSVVSFGVALVGVGIGVAYLPVDRWIRGFLALGLLYVVTSTFTLAKCVRDHHEFTAVQHTAVQQHVQHQVQPVRSQHDQAFRQRTA